MPVRGAIELEPDAVEQVALGSREAFLETIRGVRRILALRQGDDLHLEPLRRSELHSAKGCLLTRRVGIEAKIDLPGQAPELAELALGQRRPHRRNGGLEARLSECDHIRVALDHSGVVLLGDRNLREMEPVQDRALVEQISLGRVDVLPAQRIVLVDLAGLEADHTPACVREREHQPLREVVAPPHSRKARPAELVGREPLLGGLLRQTAAG